MVTLELLTTSQIVVFNIPSELELVYSEPLTSLLGLTHPTEYCRDPRTRTVNKRIRKSDVFGSI